MIDYNLIVYIGIVLMVLIFILFIANEMDKRKKDIELFKKQQQLRKSLKLGFEMAIDLIDTRNKLNHLREEKTKLTPMTEEEEYKNAGITKEEINDTK